MKIALGMLPELGHLAPTLSLARNLRGAGHEVVYLGVADFEGWVRERGFGFVPVFETVFPRGALTESRPETAETLAARFAAYGQYLQSGALESRLREARPDLVLADALNDFLMLSAWSLGLPCLRLSTSLPQGWAPGVPPLSSPLPYDASAEGLARSEEAWEALLRSRADQGGYHAIKLASLVHRYGYPLERIDRRGSFEMELPEFPEIVLGPSRLDFPRPPSDRRIHAESLWLERPEVPFPWEVLDGRPLVYISGGSQAHRRRETLALRGLAAEVAAAMPEHQFVMAMPEGGPGEAARPSNLIEVRFAPQLALIERSCVVLGHGGLGSLKECFYHGKPVVVIPGRFDQPGNAARVRHHGLGAAFDASSVTAADVEEAIRRLPSDAAVQANVALVREELVTLEREQPGRRWIEAYLSRSG
ncbi:glycosyltransferase [Sorangium sp. So ce1335]|uniref:glycosyltransferase n=1 Tax=Sorangium sp. So ce1335 TaxID=3133335 RepID=UPI003F5F6328